jgi:hypothetical protein
MRYHKTFQNSTGKSFIPIKIEFCIDLDFIANVLCFNHEAYGHGYPITKAQCMETIKTFLIDYGKAYKDIESDDEYNHARKVAKCLFPELA